MRWALYVWRVRIGVWFSSTLRYWYYRKRSQFLRWLSPWTYIHIAGDRDGYALCGSRLWLHTEAGDLVSKNLGGTIIKLSLSSRMFEDERSCIKCIEAEYP